LSAGDVLLLAGSLVFILLALFCFALAYLRGGS
jgi:hypothetical protein